MSYDRTYSVSEVLRFLEASEGRPRPDRTNGDEGHAIRIHSKERKDPLSRPPLRPGAPPHDPPPGHDSTILVSRNDLAAIVQEALNSVPGQKKLKQLNQPTKRSVGIRTIILRKGKDFDILTVYRPPPDDADKQCYFDWLSTTNGDGYIAEVVVRAVKLPNSTEEELHIQTTFPAQFARTQGEDIVPYARPT